MKVILTSKGALSENCEREVHNLLVTLLAVTSLWLTPFPTFSLNLNLVMRFTQLRLRFTLSSHYYSQLHFSFLHIWYHQSKILLTVLLFFLLFQIWPQWLNLLKTLTQISVDKKRSNFWQDVMYMSSVFYTSSRIYLVIRILDQLRKQQRNTLIHWIELIYSVYVSKGQVGIG